MPYTKLRSHHCYKTHITSVIYTFLPTLPILIRCFILYLCDIYAPQANKNNNSKSYSKVRNEDVHSTLFVVFHQIIEYALLATYYLLKAIKTSLSSFFRYQNLISFYIPEQTYLDIHIAERNTYPCKYIQIDIILTIVLSEFRFQFCYVIFP